MAWIVPTETDLASALSQAELDAFRASAPADGSADPVAGLLSATAQQVRAAVRANRAVAMAANPASIPQSLLRACLAIAAYDVLKRLPVSVGEDRRIAKDDALDLLGKVASGSVVPESDGADDSSSNIAGPVWDSRARFRAD